MTHGTINIKPNRDSSISLFCPSCGYELKINYQQSYLNNTLHICCPKCKEHIRARITTPIYPSIGLPLAKGTVLSGQEGKYTIHEVLGKGSFGISYLAEAVMNMQKEHEWLADKTFHLPVMETKKMVVVKEFFMSQQMARFGNGVVDFLSRNANMHYFQSFKQETEILRQLHNEHIVTLYDTFEANNTMYYVMEYFERGSLQKLWKGTHGLEDECRAIEIIQQIAYGAEYLHGKNFVHLDIKPSNIMQRDDGTWVLIDFGIARRKRRTHDTTSAGYPLGGSMGFAPLEQSAANPPDQALTRMDIYALGATYYWLCNGMPPDAYEMLSEGFPLKELSQKGITPFTIHIIQKAMQPLYAQRYQDVGQFIDALQFNRQYIDTLKEKGDSKQGYNSEKIEISSTNDHGSTSAQIPRTLYIFDNENDGHTIITKTINQIDFGCEIGRNTTELEKILDNMVPSLSGLISNQPVGTFDSAFIALSHIEKLQSLTSLRLQLPIVSTLEKWAEEHSNFVCSNPMLCFNTATADIYAATIEQGKLTNIVKTDLRRWEKYDLLIELNTQPTPYHFMPSYWSFGFHPVSKNGKWGLLRDDKKIVIALDYDRISTVHPIQLPGSGWGGPCFIGCLAEKDDHLFFYELTHSLDMKQKADMTKADYQHLQTLT